MTDLPGGPPEEAGPDGRDAASVPGGGGTEPASLASAARVSTGRTIPGIDLPGPQRIRAAWGRGRTSERIGLAIASVVALILIGAFLFGFWHVLAGGFYKGNWRAGGFGIALASASGVLLWIDAIVLRRLGARE